MGRHRTPCSRFRGTASPTSQRITSTSRARACSPPRERPGRVRGAPTAAAATPEVSVDVRDPGWARGRGVRGNAHVLRGHLGGCCRGRHRARARARAEHDVIEASAASRCSPCRGTTHGTTGIRLDFSVKGGGLGAPSRGGITLVQILSTRGSVFRVGPRPPFARHLGSVPPRTAKRTRRRKINGSVCAGCRPASRTRGRRGRVAASHAARHQARQRFAGVDRRRDRRQQRVVMAQHDFGRSDQFDLLNEELHEGALVRVHRSRWGDQ